MAEKSMRERITRDLPWVGAALALLMAYGYVRDYGLGVDARAYWLASQGATYDSAPGDLNAFLYSPLFVQVLSPLTALSWPIFLSLWTSLAAATFVFLLWPMGFKRATPCFLMCSMEIVTGNVFWLFALVVAFGLRQPGLWLIPLATKITPAIGPIWFLARRDWRNLVYSGVVTVVIVGLSMLIDPVSWRDWFEFLLANLSSTSSEVGSLSLPPVVRIPLGVALVIWGAWRNKIWTIPASMVLVTPVFGPAALVVLAGLPRLRESRGRHNNELSLGGG